MLFTRIGFKYLWDLLPSWAWCLIGLAIVVGILLILFKWRKK